MGSTLETPTAPVVASPLVAAAHLLRGLAWALALALGGLLVFAYPLSLGLLLYGGFLFAAPAVAFSIIGFRLSKALRRGHRAVASMVLAEVQGCALFALALHSTTWHPGTPGEKTFFLATTVGAFLGGAANAVAVFLIAAGLRRR